MLNLIGLCHNCMYVQPQVQMLVEEQRRTKYLTLTTIGTLVTMLLLIGCLTGMTFGVVKLAAETKVTVSYASSFLMHCSESNPFVCTLFRL